MSEEVGAEESNEGEANQSELQAAIAENPEAVAEFVERLDAVNELLDVLALGESALTDEMARDVAGTTATLAESADGIATDETAALAETVGENGAEIEAALESVLALQRSGTLEELVELAEVVSLLTAALDDEMVRSLAGTGSGLGELAQTAADEETREGLDTLLSSVGAAERDTSEPVGALGLIKATRDPEVKRGLGYLLSLSRAIGRSQSDDGADSR
ncbi:helical membrane plugin domain-containing protein [Halobellus marinus]|jgi:uncharacterized protein YjgD (DUF1641 family)|uniref:DUF1641 domain-containing protein n=1 Tax=Halobellus TaxID=1073986 RepID=UPI0028AC7627|nr:DUF1641 domain-containing protein [Halobellus sp. DFY28]